MIELIIVIAIMVALVAILAPYYTRYARSARDAVMSVTAQDTLSVAQAAYANCDLTGSGDITISASRETGHVTVSLGEGLKYGDGTGNGQEEFDIVCGVDPNKKVFSDKVYVIEVRVNDGVPSFKVVETTTDS